MAATIRRRALFSAAIFAMATALTMSAGAQEDTEQTTDDAATRTQIVTDPDIRRMEERRRRLEVLSGLFERQTRVFRISYRLLYAAVDMCPTRARPAVGFTYANAYMFQGAVRTAATAMGYTHRVSVVELASNSAAARAGVQRRDELIAIDQWPVPFGEGAVTLTQAKLRDVLVRDSRTTLTLRRGDGTFAVVIEPDYLCDIQVLAVPGDPIRAYADGDKVVVFEGLHRSIDDDDVLAAAIAREIANNLIPDLDIDADNGIEWANFFEWGLEAEPTGDVLADQSLAQDYGSAADYVGAYLMARAGFDHRKAPDLWYRMADPSLPAPQHSYGIAEPEYLLGLEQTVDEIERKLAARAPLLPEQSGPPTALAAAPTPTGPSAPEPVEAPEPIAVAEAETVPDVTVADVITPAPVPKPVVDDLPWLAPSPAGEPVISADASNLEFAPGAPEIAAVTRGSDLPVETADIEPPAADNAPFDVSEMVPAPGFALDRPILTTTEPRPSARENGTAFIPASEPPESAMAALGIEPPEPTIIAPEPEPVAADIDAPAVVAIAKRPIATPATGDAEIAVLFRNQPSPDPAVVTTEVPAELAELPEPTTEPQIAAAPEPESTTAVEPTPSRNRDEFDIGDLIIELEAADNAAATPDEPETPAPEANDLPWLTEAANTPAPAATPGVVIAVGPALKITRSDLVKTPPNAPIVEQPAAIPPAEITFTAVEPSTDSKPITLEPSFIPTPAPDRAATPVDALPTVTPPSLPDLAPPANKLASAVESDIEEISVDPAFDLIVPSAGQSSAGADPAELGKGFSFRAWLGES